MNDNKQQRRAICISTGAIHYPGSPFDIGEIVFLNKEGLVDVYEDKYSYSIRISDAPHLFKEIAFYEYCNIEDMPKFAKINDDIYKVKSWHGYIESAGDNPRKLRAFDCDDDDKLVTLEGVSLINNNSSLVELCSNITPVYSIEDLFKRYIPYAYCKKYAALSYVIWSETTKRGYSGYFKTEEEAWLDAVNKMAKKS